MLGQDPRLALLVHRRSQSCQGTIDSVRALYQHMHLALPEDRLGDRTHCKDSLYLYADPYQSSELLEQPVPPPSSTLRKATLAPTRTEGTRILSVFYAFGFF